MSGYSPFRTRIRALVMDGKSDDEIRAQFCGQLRHAHMNDVLRSVRDDLKVRRSTLGPQHSVRVIEERDGERFVEFAPGHVAKESALRAIRFAKGGRA